MKPYRCLLLVLVTGVVACSSRAGQPSENRAGTGSATVVRGSELGGDLLQGLRNRVPSMTVSERSGECPMILFRGQRSINSQRNPDVYVDGTRVFDTCILNQISTMAIDSVEVYPNGDAMRPGVQQSPFGVILIFRVME